jgi:hypothetical protein
MSRASFSAAVQNFYLGEEFVVPRSVSPVALAACSDERFSDPTGEWDLAAGKLRDYQAVILRAPRGSGRLTAALRLLRGVAGDDVHLLDAAWERPRKDLFCPLDPGHGYVLDMTEPSAEEPEDHFGAHLIDLAHESAAYLAVITTGETWSGPWVAGAQIAEVRIGSPDAKDLVSRVVITRSQGHRLTVLDEPDLNEVWNSRPNAADAHRLSVLVTRKPELSSRQIVEEYTGWRDWIDKNLPADLDPRVLMWSAAFCDGGSRKSVLKMAETLRVLLNAGRSNEQVLLDPPASRRLKDAKITPSGDAVELEPSRHGLAAAVRQQLWDEYDEQRPLLTRWLASQLLELPAADGSRIASAMLELAVGFHDDQLLIAIRNMPGTRGRQLAAALLGKAVVDPRSGAYVRSRLYAWLKGQPSQDVIDVSAEVCGGEFGRLEPDMALTRLRLAAQGSVPDSETVAAAFVGMAETFPGKVLTAIGAWLAKPGQARAGVIAFLALSSKEAGVAVIHAAVTGSVGRQIVTEAFRQALADHTTRAAALKVAGAWGTAVETGQADPDVAVSLFAEVLSPYLGENVMARFLPDAVDISTFWGRVFQAAVLYLQPRDETDHGNEEDTGGSKEGCLAEPVATGE